MAKVILFAAFLCVAGGLAFLAFSDIPAPVKTVEKPISADKFSKR